MTIGLHDVSSIFPARDLSARAAILVLAFGTGVATVGALYRLVLARLISEDRRLRTFHAAERAGERAQDLEVGDASVFRLIVLLTRYALLRRPGA